MKQHEEWLQKAVHDLKSAIKLADGPEPIYDTAAYHTQQCAEKALKAFLAYNEKAIIKSHDLEQLITLCSEIDNSFEDLIDIAYNLNPFSTIFRYPSGLTDPDFNDVSDAIKDAKKIYEFVFAKIKVE